MPRLGKGQQRRRRGRSARRAPRRWPQGPPRAPGPWTCCRPRRLVTGTAQKQAWQPAARGPPKRM
eukprot:6984476-Lingulodinium_polyedra.AAC.1